MLVELEVAQVSVDPFLAAPVLVLRDPVTDRRIVARVAQGEAVSLMSVLEKIPLGCPTMHELALAVLDATGGALLRVELEPRHERGACGAVVLRAPDGRGEIRLQVRLVDGVAMAMRAGVPIYADDSVLEAAVEVELAGCPPPCPEWAGPADLLETLPEEEFPKYKM